MDVKAESLKLVFFVVAQKASQALAEADLAAYIGSVLWNVNEVKKDSATNSPLKLGRRQTEPVMSSPLAPVPPSHRHNPAGKFSFEAVPAAMEEEKTIDPESAIKPIRKKRTLTLNIDTEKINELYSYGGEKGKQVVVDEQEEEGEVQRIRDLALKCLKRMRQGTVVAGPKDALFSVREQRKVSFPVAALNSTRNQDLNDRKPRSFGGPALRIA